MPETGNRTRSALESVMEKEECRTILDGTVVSDDSVLHRVVPQTTVDEVAEEPRVDNLELSSEDTARVDVAVRAECWVSIEEKKSVRSSQAHEV